ncbi:acyltransferase [Chloroflexota bacterium]
MSHVSEMGESIKEKLNKCGSEVKIYPMAKVIKPEVIEIGDYSRIGDFTFVYGGNGIRIGKYVNIAGFVSIIGGGELVIGDYAAVSWGSRIITGTDTYYGGKRMSAALPKEQRNLIIGKVVIEKDAFIGANAILHPNVRIGEGAIIGSNSLVLKDIEPWSVNVGSPCTKIGERPRVVMPDI